MLLIPCIYCGPRAEVEFTYGGEAYRNRPAEPDALSDEEWSEYLYMKRNPKGLNQERWVHSGGCGQWFILERDTVTHKIFNARLPGADRGQGSAA